MTNREFYETVIAAAISDEVTAKATALRDAKLAQNSARKAKEAQKQKETDAPLIEALRKELDGTNIALASELATAIGVTTQKAAALLRKMEGVYSKEVKVDGRKVKGYSLVPFED